MLREGGPSISLSSETLRQSPNEWYRTFFEEVADELEGWLNAYQAAVAEIEKGRERKRELFQQVQRLEASLEASQATRPTLEEVLNVAEEAAEELHARHDVTESNGAYHVVAKLREAFSDAG